MAVKTDADGMQKRWNDMIRKQGLLKFLMLIPLLSVCMADRCDAASNDDNVEWNGVFSCREFRTPMFPGKQESFKVALRVYKQDLTAARVRVWDGSERFADMAWVRNEGPYDIWEAQVAGTTGDFIYYYFELVDGSDRDYYNGLGMWGDPPPRGDFLINTTALGRHPLGATPVGNGAVFRVWAPNADSAAVVGDFNGWSMDAHAMRRVQGFWQVQVPSVSHGDEYKYVFSHDEETLWRTDPYARAQINSTGNSVVWKREYEWHDQDWVTPFFEDMVIYQLHVGSFSGEGDGVSNHPGRFRDAVDVHLDHLVELGINMVCILPVTEFAGALSWGYNPSFLYAPETNYGTPDDLKYLVDACHQKGIGVMLDVVYNHLGGTDLAGNLLDYDGEEIYFYPDGNGWRETPWGPRPDFGRVEVRQFLRDNIRFWLDTYHMDGFRMDGTAFINVNDDGWRLLKEIVETVDVISRKAIVVAEHLPNDPWVTRPIGEGGAGLDAQWSDIFHDNLRQAIGASAFGDPDMAAVAAGLNHFDLGSGTQVVNYIESHDEAHVHGRVSVAADGADPESEWAYGRSKAAAALVLFSAGIPMMLQGQEFLENRPFGDGTSERIQWEYCQRHGDFLLFMQDAVRLRKTQPALRSNGLQNVYHVNDGGNVLAFQRWTDEGHDLVVVVSLASNSFENYELGFPQAGVWYEILNGDAEVYGGTNQGNAGQVTASGPARHGFAQSAAIVVPRMGVLVFAREPWATADAGFLRADCNGDAAVDLSDAISVLTYLFGDGMELDCLAACNANGDLAIDLADAIYILGYLFSDGGPPPAPWPDCASFAAPLPCARRCAF